MHTRSCKIMMLPFRTLLAAILSCVQVEELSKSSRNSKDPQDIEEPNWPMDSLMNLRIPMCLHCPEVLDLCHAPCSSDKDLLQEYSRPPGC